MKIIAGLAKGRVIKIPKDLEIVPTAGKVKMALFEILKYELEDMYVLDMFGGSGSLGLEALSRGAKRAVFIDNNPGCVKIIKENAVVSGFESFVDVIYGDAEQAAARLGKIGEKFTLVLIDPPYNTGLVKKALKAVFDNDILKPGGIVAVKRHKKEELPAVGFEFSNDERIYGDTILNILRKKN